MRRERVQGSFPAEVESVRRAVELVSGFASTLALDAVRVGHLELAVEEAAANVCRYAYPAGGGHLIVRSWCDAQRVVVEVEDEGLPFDPTAAPEPDLDSDLAARPIGGLGVHMIREVMDEVSYRRDGDRNILTMAIHR